MKKIKSKNEKRIRRHARIRARIHGTPDCPRLSIFRSNKHVWAQLIDDASGKTLVSAGDIDLKKKQGKLDSAKEVGIEVAKAARGKKITRIVFDRGGYRYHGIVKAVAEGARKGGLEF